jgi:predicted acyl esterase
MTDTADPTRPAPDARRQPWRRAALIVTLTGALLLASCSGDDSSDAGPEGSEGDRPSIDVDEAAPLPEGAEVVAGTSELTITGVEPGELVHVVADDGTVLVTGTADELGQLHTAYVPDEYLQIERSGEKVLPTSDGSPLAPGTYRVAVGPLDGDGPAVSDEVEVLGKDHVPDPDLYEGQQLTGVETPIIGGYPEGVSGADGFQYLEVRDGTLLSATVKFPDASVFGEPPYPTVIEMEGYAASNPASDPPGARIARSFGYATVSVNIRGTGCSGGVFDLFSAAQQVDTYDIVETVARQPWVKHGKVGVLGLSYSGLMTMYTGAMAPPSLAAIVPQSVIADPWMQQWPGGIYNGGFTKQWIAQREAASATDGESWVTEQVDGGDETCERNLRLRSQNLDFVSFARMLEARPASADDRDLRLLARQVEVPTFITGAFQDEQTGPQFIELIDNFEQAPLVRVSLWNGRHPDGYTPMNIIRWFEFLELYVNREVPRLDPLVRAGAPSQFADNFGVEDVELEPDRLYDEFGDDYEAALAAYEAEAPIRVVFENGFGEDELGEPGGTFEIALDEWPGADAEQRTWYLDADGALVEDEPAEAGVDTYDHDPEAGEETFFVATDESDGYSLFDALWEFDWTRFDDGRSLEYVTEPFEQDALLAGPSAVTLHVGSDAEDAAVQVSLIEVRPDGVEYLLTSGWLRLSARAEDESATDGLEIGRTFAAEDDEPLPEGELVEARIPLPSVGAPIRAGSQLKIQIATPGRNHGTWTFESLHDEGEAPTHRIGRGPDAPSAITLTFLPGVDIPAGVPPCPSLRGQACRDAQPVTNRTEG